MTGKKSVAWSAIINLGNEESLGLVVTGEAETPDEGQEVALYAAGQLIGMADRADKSTGDMIRAYVRRVFSAAPPAPTTPKPAPEVREPRKEDPSIYDKPRPAPSTRAAATLNQISPLPERMPAPVAKSSPATPTPSHAPTTAEQAAAAVQVCIKPPAAPPTPEASASAERPAAPPVARTAPAEVVCEACGAPVTKSQAKLSQLFLSKIACKDCMEAAR
jgi:hypothetical protein